MYFRVFAVFFSVFTVFFSVFTMFLETMCLLTLFSQAIVYQKKDAVADNQLFYEDLHTSMQSMFSQAIVYFLRFVRKLCIYCVFQCIYWVLSVFSQAIHVFLLFSQAIVYQKKETVADNQLFYEDHQGVLRCKLTDFVLDASGSLV